MSTKSARGLEYYTGVIHEAIAEASTSPVFKDANALAAAHFYQRTSFYAHDEEKEINQSQVGVGSASLLVDDTTGSQNGDGFKRVNELELEIEEAIERLNQLTVANLKRVKTEVNYQHSSIVKDFPSEILSAIFESCVSDTVDS
ncbi:hypothetical protein CPC08DRAFT_765805 [Agrocybe pediades]|nr:hypothetical protein CPC08DRAFT_765805 [Agrocybe pediades]